MFWSFEDESVLVLIRQLERRANDVHEERGPSHRLRTELQLAGFDLGEVEHLVDKTEEMGAGAMHPLERLLSFFRAETRCIGDHHLGQADDRIERRAPFMAHAGDKL